jgi:putative ABC transport system permease protein
MLRIATDASSPRARTELIRTLERTLEALGVGIEQGLPLSEHRTAVSDHIVILIRMLIGMALVMAIVGTLGLGSTMGISVLERTREFGVMKAIGATPDRVLRMIVAEALSIGALSWGVAVVLSVPLTALVDWLVGTLGFLAPLPLVISPVPALLWLGLVGLVSLVATMLPARRASTLTVREALVQL